MSGRTLARAGLVVAVAFLVSRILGYVRIVIITNEFGAGTELDAYFAAFRVPDAIFQLVAAGALSSAMIPVLSGMFSRNEEDRAWRVVSTVLNVMLLVLFSVSIIVAIFAPQIVPIITPGFDAIGTELTVRLTRIMLLSPILLALAAVASSVLNARGRFGAAAVAPSVYNIAIIAAAIFLGPYLGVEALAIGVVFGSLLHLSIQVIPVLQEKFHLSFDIDLSDSSARQVLLLMAPRALGLGANQITFVVATMLATGVGVGAVTSYNIAWTLMQIPLGVIGFPLGIVLLPSLSRAVASGSASEFGRMIVGSVRLMVWIMLFVTTVGIVIRRPVVDMLFVGLDAHALSQTADTLSFLLLGLAFYSLVIIFARAFFSGHDTRTPVITALFDMTTSIVVSLATVGTMGLSGIALGLSCGAFAEATALGFLLWRRTPGTGLETVIKPFFVFAIGALLAAIGAAVLLRATESVVGLEPGRFVLLIQVIIASAGAALVYALYSRLLRIPELQRTFDIARSFIRRGGGPGAGPAETGGDEVIGGGEA